jgi:hypothetical protein
MKDRKGEEEEEEEKNLEVLIELGHSNFRNLVDVTPAEEDLGRKGRMIGGWEFFDQMAVKIVELGVSPEDCGCQISSSLYLDAVDL